MFHKIQTSLRNILPHFLSRFHKQITSSSFKFGTRLPLHFLCVGGFNTHSKYFLRSSYEEVKVSWADSAPFSPVVHLFSWCNWGILMLQLPRISPLYETEEKWNTVNEQLCFWEIALIFAPANTFANNLQCWLDYNLYLLVFPSISAWSIIKKNLWLCLGHSQHLVKVRKKSRSWFLSLKKW